MFLNDQETATDLQGLMEIEVDGYLMGRTKAKRKRV